MASTEAPADVVARRFRFFAETQCRGRSPLYEALSHAVAEDPELCALMAAAPEDQRRPALLLAVVHYLLADEPDDELARFYPSLGGERPLDEGAAAAFKAFCLAHRRPIEELLTASTTQTNELRRALCVALALDRAYAEVRRPLALIEAGASAGLNLLFDRYDYGGIEIHGPVPLPEAFPPVPIRVGLDLAPVDLGDPDAVRWLRAFVWPDQVEDRARLDAALALARRGPPTVLRGDALRDLPELIAATPPWAVPCCFHATLMTYLGPPAREQLFALMREAARERTVAWIYLEAAALTRGAGGPGGIPTELDADLSNFTLGLVVAGPDREAREEALAKVEPYGRRLEWLAAPAYAAQAGIQASAPPSPAARSTR
jgi:hypothetical protein